MTLEEWAWKYGVSREALYDLRARLVNTPDATITGSPEPGSEAAVQTAVRLDASRRGGRLWRNNLGACMTQEGQFIRYGLANDSRAVNDVVKSSDLIGIQPIEISTRHVGQIFGQFVARECKRPGWKYTGTSREQAQLRWLELITAMGDLLASFVWG